MLEKKDMRYVLKNLWGVIAADGAYTSKCSFSFAIPPNMALTKKTIVTDATETTIQDTVAEQAAQ